MGQVLWARFYGLGLGQVWARFGVQVRGQGIAPRRWPREDTSLAQRAATAPDVEGGGEGQGEGGGEGEGEGEGELEGQGGSEAATLVISPPTTRTSILSEGGAGSESNMAP